MATCTRAQMRNLHCRLHTINFELENSFPRINQIENTNTSNSPRYRSEQSTHRKCSRRGGLIKGLIKGLINAASVSAVRTGARARPRLNNPESTKTLSWTERVRPFAVSIRNDDSVQSPPAARPVIRSPRGESSRSTGRPDRRSLRGTLRFVTASRRPVPQNSATRCAIYSR